MRSASRPRLFLDGVPPMRTLVVLVSIAVILVQQHPTGAQQVPAEVLQGLDSLERLQQATVAELPVPSDDITLDTPV